MVDTRRLFLDKVGPLEVRSRHVFAADGSEATRSTVFCPSRERSIPVKKCALCEQFGGTSLGATGSTLFCHKRIEDLPVPTRDTAMTCSASVPVSTIMKSVLCVHPDVDLAMVEKLLIEFGISGMPVVDRSGVLAGIISKTDIVRHEKVKGDQAVQGDGGAATAVKVTAAEVMTRHPDSVLESASLAEAASRMLEAGIHRLPVVTREGEVIGIVTPVDILEWVVKAT